MTRVDSWKGAAEVALQWQKISSLSCQPWQLRWMPVCGSTELILSRWLLEKPKDLQPRALFSRRQSFGKGQRGRVWKSPIGGIWLSAAFPWPHSNNSAGVMGLSVAIALAEGLEARGIPAQIKWPNDLLVKGRKLAGFLPRLVLRGNKVRFARIGLGLNVINNVPPEGISLRELLRPSECDLSIWSVEVLLALERAIALAGDAPLVISESEKRLWAESIRDPVSGDIWTIKGVDSNGSLKLSMGLKEKTISRW